MANRNWWMVECYAYNLANKRDTVILQPINWLLRRQTPSLTEYVLHIVMNVVKKCYLYLYYSHVADAIYVIVFNSFQTRFVHSKYGCTARCILSCLGLNDIVCWQRSICKVGREAILFGCRREQ